MNNMTSSETRDIILDVTEKLIYRHGIAATGMDFLVKTAGVSRKSIYRYFADKDALTVAALQRRGDAVGPTRPGNAGIAIDRGRVEARFTAVESTCTGRTTHHRPLLTDRNSRIEAAGE